MGAVMDNIFYAIHIYAQFSNTGLPKKKDPPNVMIIDLGKIAQFSKEQPGVVLTCFPTSFWSFVKNIENSPLY